MLEEETLFPKNLFIFYWTIIALDIPGGASGKEHPTPTPRQCRRCKRRGFDPCVGKIPGVENSNPLQYSCLENPMDRGAWRATVHGVTNSQTKLKLLNMLCSKMPASISMCLCHYYFSHIIRNQRMGAQGLYSGSMLSSISP